MMNCHMCGQREATIHLFELIDGDQTSVWLCDICASGRTDLTASNLGSPFPLASANSLGESGSLASFLGQSTNSEGSQQDVSACPKCGYNLSDFQSTNRLGCVHCYVHFRDQVQPILG
ncbi:MAG: protein arginine kinase activator, partial [Candidatus Krumholzibacteriia bacterium]